MDRIVTKKPSVFYAHMTDSATSLLLDRMGKPIGLSNDYEPEMHLKSLQEKVQRTHEKKLRLLDNQV